MVEAQTYKPEGRGFDSRWDTQTPFFMNFVTALYVHQQNGQQKHYVQQANLHNKFVLLECKLASTLNELHSGKEFFETQALPKVLQHFIPKI